MFAKLLKQEFRATSKLLGMLSGIALLVGVAAAAALKGLVWLWQEDSPMAESDVIIYLTTALSFMLIGAALALLAYAVCSEIVLLLQFYRKKFTDQGYLTFTLPVTNHQIIFSSYLNILIWTFITFVVTILTISIPVFFGSSATQFFNKEALSVLQIAWNSMWEITNQIYFENALTGILSVVLVIIQGLASVMMVLTAITIGCTVAKTHKILASIGIYYGISMGLGIVSSMLQFPILIISRLDVESYMTMTMLPQAILYLIVLVGGYFLTAFLMKRKLNLP